MFTRTKRPENVAMLADTEGGEHRFTRKRMPRNYRPSAIRAPTLLLFLSVLAVYISLIEYVLHRSSKPESSTSNSQPATTSRKRSLLAKRAATCDDLPRLNSVLASLDSAQNTMCAQFSATYKSVQSLSPPQTSAFQQWLGSFDQVDASLSQVTRDLEAATQDCGSQQITDAPGLDRNPAPSTLIRVACDTTSLERGCYGGGKIYVTAGTITSSASLVCAASQSAMLSITSSSYISASSVSSAMLTITSQSSQSSPTTTVVMPTSTGSALLTLTSQAAPLAVTTVIDYGIGTSQSPTPTSDRTTRTAGIVPTSSLLTLTISMPAESLLTLTSQQTTKTVGAVPSSSLLTLTMTTAAGLLTLTSQQTTRTAGIVPTSSLLTLSSMTTAAGLLTLTSETGEAVTINTADQKTTYPVASTKADQLTLTSQNTNPTPLPFANTGDFDTSTTRANIIPTASLLTLTTAPDLPAPTYSDPLATPDATGSGSGLLTLTSAATNPAALLTITSQSTDGVGLLVISVTDNPSATVSDPTYHLTVSAAPDSAFLSLTTVDPAPDLSVNSKPVSKYLQTVSADPLSANSGQSLYTYTTEYTSMVTTTDSEGHSTIVPVVVSQQTVDTSRSLYTYTTEYTSMMATTDSEGHSTTVPVIVLQQTVGTSQSLYTYITEYTSMVATTDSEGRSTTMPVVVSKQTVGTSRPLWTVTTAYTTMIGTTDSMGRSTSVSVVVVHPTVLTTSPAPSTAVLPASTKFTGPTSTAPSTPFATLQAHEVVFDEGVNGYTYIAAFFLPPILAVVVKSFWEIIFSNFKMMEPFHRMSKAGGASAEQTFSTQYLSNSISIDAIKSCLSGSVLPLITTSVYLVVTMLASIAASSMTVRATANCEVSPGQYMRCNPIWVTNVQIIRIVEALLLLCALLTLLLVFTTRKYRTGVPSNPSTIASIASLMNDESVLHDFRLADPMAETNDLVAVIQHRKYKLEYHENVQGNLNYGLSHSRSPKSSDLSPRGSYSSPAAPRKWLSGYSAVSNPHSARSRKLRTCNFFSHKTEARLLDGAQLVSSMGLFAIVTAYFIDRKSDPFNDFFNSGTFWARFVMVAIASLVDTQWKRLEREVRITEPYRRMAKGFARPETTVLMPLNGTCWSGLFSSIYYATRYRNMWFQSLVSTTAALSDFNIIAIAGVVWSDAQTIPTLRICSAIVMSITVLMMLVMLLTMFWWRRTVVGKMPRCPDTVAAVVSYLCASRLTRELANAQLEHVSREERDEMVIATGWRYSFRHGLALDHQERWFVDFEVPTSKAYNVNEIQTGYG